MWSKLVPLVTVSLVAVVGFGSSDRGHAAPLLSFVDFKSYRQYDTWTSRYQGGSLAVGLVDGFVVIDGCAGNGGVAIMQPNLMCPLGTTGFIAWGDVDGDGLSDSNSFWAVAAVQGASVVAPQRANQFQLYAAPPSKLPRPLSGLFYDASVQVWYNMLAMPPARYTITRYSMIRDYTDLRTQWDEVVPGVYIFQVPILPALAPGYPDPTTYLQVSHLQLIEAWPGRGHSGTINDFLLLQPNNWNAAEQVQMDPRMFNEFIWRGFNYNSILAGDTTLFSMYANDDPAEIKFPPYDDLTPFTDRSPELLNTPSQGIEIGPYLYLPGDQFTARIEFGRDAPSSSVATDRSFRHFEWNVLFIDSYEGWATARIPASFPPGTPESLKQPNADFDGDGWTNLEEFALEPFPADPLVFDTIPNPVLPDQNLPLSADPANPASVPFVQPIRDPDTLQIILELAKRPFVGSSLTYEIDYSYDRTTWTTIRPGDPVYLIEFDNADRIKVRSRAPAPPENSFLRVRVILH